ncbi:MAG: trehalose-phosphatase [Halorhodospira sp.]
MHRPQYLFDPEVLEPLLAQLRTHTTPLFLDYDGTLAPIVSDPMQAQMAPSMRPVLEHLAARHTVAIVSGRDLQTLQRFVDLDNVYYAGSHGFEITGPGGVHKYNEEAERSLTALETAAQELEEELAGIHGAALERKRFALAVHYRNTPQAEIAQVTRAVEAVTARHPELRYGPGKRVYELQPDVDWDKGRAVLWLLDALSLNRRDVLPVYIGDDWTDEHAFRALEGRGVGIFVGERNHATEAQYRVAGIEEVRQLFERLLEESES